MTDEIVKAAILLQSVLGPGSPAHEALCELVARSERQEAAEAEAAADVAKRAIEAAADRQANDARAVKLREDNPGAAAAMAAEQLMIAQREVNRTMEAVVAVGLNPAEILAAVEPAAR